MKFVLFVEEDGYELRYWDEINEEIRDSVVSPTWDVNVMRRQLVSMEFNIKKRTLQEAIEILESGRNSFVILSSKNKPNHLDTLHEDVFEIEK